MVRIAEETENIFDEIHEYKLDNGLRIIYHPTRSQVTYCGYAINVGTRDENLDESGMAHFTEHLIFKGTEKRRANHILNRLSNVGGDIDAFTNKEETIVYATVLNKDFDRAIELLSDIVFHSVFPQRELEKEREVILDEISSYEDTPSELIYDEFENVIFKNHPLGRNILGTPKTISKFTSEDVLSFTRRFYCTDNMVFFASGNLDLKKIIRLAQKYTVDAPVHALLPDRLPPVDYIPRHIEMKKATHQAHVIIGCPGFKSYHPHSAGLYLLNNLLGGVAINNRLNLSLREHSGLVYTVESSLSAYTDTGNFCIYFGSGITDVNKCLHLVYKELKRLRENKLSSLQLSIAKHQIKGQMGIANENDENNALEMAKIYLHYGRYDTLKDAYTRVDALTSDELLAIANEKFNEDNLTTLIFC
jgi:predicted Zn-dependent peptidase